jgi:citrate synthase
MSDSKDLIFSRLWGEEAEADNPFVARRCYCSGYDVYGDIVPRASYAEYLFLLFRGERPDRDQARAFEMLALALANPGSRDPSVHAAMAAGVGGSPAAAALMAALAAGAGSSGGAREVLLVMRLWQQCGYDLVAWHEALANPARPTRLPVWPDIDHPPGFLPHHAHAAQPALQTLQAVTTAFDGAASRWLFDRHATLSEACGHGLALPGVAAAVLHDLGFSPEEGEMLTLLLRLPGAAALTLEQGKRGFRHFPFFSIHIANDPGPQAG